MEHTTILLVLLRRLVFLALCGFVVVMVAGPVFAVLGILIAFAAIGLLVWLPLRLLGFGKPIKWHRVRDAGHKCWGAVAVRGNRVRGEILTRGQPYLTQACETGRYLGRIFRETMSGALVGAMLGLIPAVQYEHVRPMILGACFGALVGAIVGLSSRSPAREVGQAF